MKEWRERDEKWINERMNVKVVHEVMSGECITVKIELRYFVIFAIITSQDVAFFFISIFILIFVLDGYCYKFNQQLVTVWSAPNYCNRGGNLASGIFIFLQIFLIFFSNFFLFLLPSHFSIKRLFFSHHHLFLHTLLLIWIDFVWSFIIC